MTEPIDFSQFKNGLILLGTAGVVVPLMYRFNISPVLGFLLAGAILGPNGLGELTMSVPWLSSITISDQAEISLFAELGVVFLLFFIGLELSLQRLVTMRKLVFGLGSLQVILSTLVIGGIVVFMGLPVSSALVIGACLALSSTAVVLEILSQQKRLKSGTGRVSFSVLLMQDLAVVPILFLVGILGAKTQGSVLTGLLFALVQAALVIGVIFAAGQYALQPLFRLVAGTRNTDLFVATTLLVVVGTSLLTASFGLSMALGAFMAGLLLAETEYRRAIEATIEPFKGLLLGVFFFSVGMRLDAGFMAANALAIFGAVAALVIIKSVIITLLARAFSFPWFSAIKAGLLLAAGGEFAFVVTGAAMHTGLVPDDVGNFIMLLAAVTMALIPALDKLGRYISWRVDPPKPVNLGEAMVIPDAQGAKRALLVGYGRVGRMVASLLEAHGTPFLAVDHDADEVARARQQGHRVYFGEAMNELFLKTCGIEDAPAVIITSHSAAEIDRIVVAVRTIRPDVAIISRARDSDHARHLYEMGVTIAIPETIEASLQLSEAALISMGVAAGPVIATIHQKRDDVRQELVQAAQNARALAREKGK